MYVLKGKLQKPFHSDLDILESNRKRGFAGATVDEQES